MTVYVLAEHDNLVLKPLTLSAVTAAKAMGTDVRIIVIGHDCRSVVDTAKTVKGIAKVHVFDAAHLKDPVAEDITGCLMTLKNEASAFVAPASTFGKNVMPRLAALLDTMQVSDIISVESMDTFTRPIYAGNAIATVTAPEGVKVITVRPTTFDRAAVGGGNAEFVTHDAPAPYGKAQFVKLEASKSERPELTSARVVVSGGRGVGSSENFALIEALADKLGGAVGASRAAVDSGYVPNDYQVGQTGKVVAPELYIAIGLSGAIQHLAGMKDSKVIVAINKDPDAPIFSVADYGLIADLFDAVPEMTGKL